MKNAEDHYDKRYFERQSKGGDLQGIANLFKFEQFLEPGSRILDFGCGDGALLKALGGGAGVEINPHGASVAASKGFDVRPSLSDFHAGTFDLVVSNHVLEHVEDPLTTMREIHRVLRTDGKTVIVVPCDSPSMKYWDDDPDLHLFSWSANNIGNLAKVAGFVVEEAKEIVHTWPPHWDRLQERFGWSGFHIASRIWGTIDRRRGQVRLVARKPGF